MFVLLLVCSQLLSADMASAQQESDEEARKRAAVVESQNQRQAADRAAAAATAGGATQPAPQTGNTGALSRNITQAQLQAMMSEAVKAVSEPISAGEDEGDRGGERQKQVVSVSGRWSAPSFARNR